MARQDLTRIFKRSLFFQQEKLTRDAGFDRSLHVMDCFHQGITGKGVKIVILDDGLDYKHDDIFSNYVISISHYLSFWAVLQLIFNYTGS